MKAMVPNVGKMKAERDVEGLIQALDYQEVCEGAAQALGEIREPRAIESLITMLGRGFGNSRCQVAAGDALIKIGASAVGALIAALDGEYYRREAAKGALVRIGAPAIEQLSAALDCRFLRLNRHNRRRGFAARNENSKSVREAAVEVLGKIGNVLAVMPLISALRDSNDDVRFEAAKALARIPDSRAVLPLIALLKENMHARRPVCHPAAEALANIGAPAVEPLNAVLKDDSSHLRETAAEILEKIGNVLAVMPLIAALKDEVPSVRGRVAAALAKIGDTRAVEPLVAMLNGDNGLTDTYGDMCAAASALNKIGWLPRKDTDRAAYLVGRREWGQCVGLGRLAIKPLLVAVTSLSSGAAATLEKIDWRPTEDKYGACYWIAKNELGRAAQIGAPAIKPLIALLNERFEVRKAAAETLVTLYHSGMLNEAQAGLILAKRYQITEPHKIVYSGNDAGTTSTDYGIGVDFPI